MLQESITSTVPPPKYVLLNTDSARLLTSKQPAIKDPLKFFNLSK